LAYPFASAYSYKQLKEKLEQEFCCSFKQGIKLKNSNGVSFSSTYATRNVNGKEIKRAMEFGLDDELINPNVLRSICARLEIDITLFPGYHLG
jgi:hypothetical protein